MSAVITAARPGPLNNIIQGTILAVLLTAGSYGLAVGLGWIATINLLEAFAVFTSYLCTYLCVTERRINYPIGAISTAAYCVLFWQAGLIASMALNAWLTPYLFYGWLRWGKDTNTRPVHHISLKWLPVYAVATAIVYFSATLVVGSLGGALVWTDTIILVGTVLAQLLLDNKVLENWAVWAVVNVFAIYTYWHVGLALAAVQYVAFLLNTLFGWYMWARSMHANPKELPKSKEDSEIKRLLEELDLAGV